MKHEALIEEVAATLDYDEEPDVDFTTKSVDDLAGLDADLSRLAGAVRWLQRKTLEAMHPHLGDRGYAKYTSTVYRAAPEFKWKVKPEAANEFWEWVRSENAARQLFNPNGARIGQLRELGEAWCDRETGEAGWGAFEARFLDTEYGAVKVSVMPTDKAPKFIQKAEDGEVVKKTEPVELLNKEKP